MPPVTYTPSCLVKDHDPTLRADGAIVCATCGVVLVTTEGMKVRHKLALII